MLVDGTSISELEFFAILTAIPVPFAPENCLNVETGGLNSSSEWASEVLE